MAFGSLGRGTRSGKGKAPYQYREMRGFAGREKQPQSGALRHCKRAACVLGLAGANTAAPPGVRIPLLIWSSSPTRPPVNPVRDDRPR